MNIGLWLALLNYRVFRPITLSNCQRKLKAMAGRTWFRVPTAGPSFLSKSTCILNKVRRQSITFIPLSSPLVPYSSPCIACQHLNLKTLTTFPFLIQATASNYCLLVILVFRKLPEVQFYYIPTLFNKLFLFSILELAHEVLYDSYPPTTF